MADTTEIILRPTTAVSLARPEPRAVAIPSIVADAGPAAIYAWDELFRGSIRNAHTRAAYGRSVRSLHAWLEAQHVPLSQVTPGMVGSYLDAMIGSIPTQKLALAAIRRFCDTLVLRHVFLVNPAATVRGERYEAVEGKTPEVSAEQARTLLASIDTATAVGLRDRAVIATLIYTAARAGAVAQLRRNDLIFDGSQYLLRFAEKGGKQRQIPVRHDLQGFLLAYAAAAIPEDAPPPLPSFALSFAGQEYSPAMA
jgi:integrase/recombinase XerD